MSKKEEIKLLEAEWDKLREEGFASIENQRRAEAIIREMKRNILSIAEVAVFRRDEKHFSERDLLRLFRGRLDSFKWYIFPVYRLFEAYTALCGNVKVHCPETGFAAYNLSDPEKMKELTGTGLCEELFSLLIVDQCRIYEPGVKPGELHNRLSKARLLGIYTDGFFTPEPTEWIVMMKQLAEFYTYLSDEV